MKALAYMIIMLALGSVGGLFFGSFWSIFVYYNFTVIRPQYLWQYALPPGIEWSFYAAIAPIGYALLGLGETGRPGRTWGTTHLTLAAFWLWSTISMLNARIPAIAYEWYMVNLKIYLMYFVASVLVADLRDVKRMYLMTAASIGYIGYEMNFEYFINGIMKVRIRGFAEYDNNGAGLILAMGIPLCWFAWEGLRSHWRWLFAALVPVLLHAVLMSFSRGAMLSLVIVTPLIVLRSRYRIATLTGVALFAFFGLPFFAGKEIQERFLSIEKSDADVSAQSRLGTWRAAYLMACDYPIFGIGVRNSPQFVGAYGHNLTSQTIHSQYLQLAADTGFVGLGLYIAFLASTVWAAVRARQYAAQLVPDVSDPTMAWAKGVEGSLVVFAVGAVFLSLETLELTYIVALIGARMACLTKAAAEGLIPGDGNLHNLPE